MGSRVGREEEFLGGGRSFSQHCCPASGRKTSEKVEKKESRPVEVCNEQRYVSRENFAACFHSMLPRSKRDDARVEGTWKEGEEILKFSAQSIHPVSWERIDSIFRRGTRKRPFERLFSNRSCKWNVVK